MTALKCVKKGFTKPLKNNFNIALKMTVCFLNLIVIKMLFLL